MKRPTEPNCGVKLERLCLAVKLAKVFRKLPTQQSDQTDEPPCAAAQGGAIMGTCCFARRLAAFVLALGLAIFADATGVRADWPKLWRSSKPKVTVAAQPSAVRHAVHATTTPNPSVTPASATAQKSDPTKKKLSFQASRDGWRRSIRVTIRRMRPLPA